MSKNLQDPTRALTRVSTGTSPVYYLEPRTSGGTVGAPANGLPEIWRMVLRQKTLVLCLLVTGLAIGWLVSYVQTPQYVARAAMEIRSMSGSESVWGIVERDWKGGSSGGPGITAESYLQTQLRLLNSRPFVRRVTDKLEAVPREASEYTYSRPRQLLVQAGVLNLGDDEEPMLPPLVYETNLLPSTWVVDIMCLSPDPDFSAEFVNTAVSEFIAFSLENQSETATKTMDWLREQLTDMRSQVDDASKALQDYSNVTGLMFEAEQPEAEKASLKDLQSRLAETQNERIAAQAAYDIAASQTSPGTISLASLPELRQRLAELQNQLKKELEIYTPAHERVRKTNAEIETVQQIMNSDYEAQVIRLKHDYETVRQREEGLRDALIAQSLVVATTTRKGMEYDTLKRDLERKRSIYENLLQKATEVSLSAAMRGSSQIRLLEPAEAPEYPIRPNRTFNMALGLLSGLFLSGGLILLKERFNDYFHSPGEIQSTLGLPELGAIPTCNKSLGSLNGDRGGFRPIQTLLRKRPGGETTPDSQAPTIWRVDRSVLVESFRGVVASILSSRDTLMPHQVLLVTSGGSGEGKSTVSCHLAIGLAELGYKVAVVDADMRRPRIHTQFGIENTWGISTMLAQNGELSSLPADTLTEKTEVPNVSVLPAGPGVANISSLVHSSRMEELFGRLKEIFDFTIVDSPPMFHVADARLIGRFVDSAILVVRSGVTTHVEANSVKQRLLDDNIPLVGTILNDWHLKSEHMKAYRSYGQGDL